MNHAARNARWALRLARIVLVLAVIVVATSSYLRLAGNGLGCAPWPACYGSTAAFMEANASAGVHAARLAHRVAATTFLVLALAASLLGWSSWGRSQRVQAGLLVGVALALAAVGLVTPSPLPWITWANVLGGFALIGLALALVLPRGAAAAVSATRPGTVVLVMLLAVVVLGGALLSVRLAAHTCQPACTAAPGGDLAALLRPDRPGDAATLAGSPGGASLLQALHRVGGLVLVLAALAVARRGLRGWHGAAATCAAIAVVALGFAQTHLASAPVGALHALAAASLIALIALRQRSGEA